YYGYRYYDPLTMRWTSADPLYRFAPDMNAGQPQRLNLYTLELNNPLRYQDPNGLEGKQQDDTVHCPGGTSTTCQSKLGTAAWLTPWARSLGRALHYGGDSVHGLQKAAADIWINKSGTPCIGRYCYPEGVGHAVPLPPDSYDPTVRMEDVSEVYKQMIIFAVSFLPEVFLAGRAVALVDEGLSLWSTGAD